MSESDPHKLPGEDAEPLPVDDRIRWDALKSAFGEFVAATRDADGLEGASRALEQIMGGLDAEQFADALHVPDDAGEFADGLRAMLIRIPDGWGRWISCERGWYPLLTELDRELSELLPSYRILQVKEKFAGLRFYWRDVERITDPSDPEPAAPLDTATPAEQARLLADHEAWERRRAAYLETPEGQALQHDLDRRHELAVRLVEHAVELARRPASSAVHPACAAGVATEPGTRRCAAAARMLPATNRCPTMTTSSVASTQFDLSPART